MPHPFLMPLVFLFAAAHPQHLGAHFEIHRRFRRVAVGEDDESVVLCVCLQVVEHTLELGATAPAHLHVLRPFLEGGNLAQPYVELHHVDGFHPVLEETGDGGVEGTQSAAVDGAAHVHRHQNVGGEVVAAAHLRKSATAVGFHAGEPPLARQDAGVERRKRLAVVHLHLQRGDNPLYHIAWNSSPVGGVADDLVDFLLSEFVFLPQSRLVGELLALLLRHRSILCL